MYILLFPANYNIFIYNTRLGFCYTAMVPKPRLWILRDIDLECKKPLYLEEIGTGLPHVYSREQRQLKDKRTLLLKCGIKYYYSFITMMYNISLAAITAIGKSNGMAEGHSQVINAHLQI